MSDGFIRFPCTGCGKNLKASAAKAGLSATCPTCKTAVSIPGAAVTTSTPLKPDIIPAAPPKATRLPPKEAACIEPLPVLEEEPAPPPRPHIVIIQNQPGPTREVIRYVDRPEEPKRKRKKPSQNMLMMLYVLTGGGAACTMAICTWFLGFPLLVMSLILGCVLLKRHGARGDVVACVVASVIGILACFGLGLFILLDEMARQREIDRYRYRY